MHRLVILICVSTAVLGVLQTCRHGHSAVTVGHAPTPQTARRSDEGDAELSLLHRYGWDTEGEPSEGKLEVPRPVTSYLPTRRYLNASRAIGMDFSEHAGQTLRLRSYNVTNEAERGREIRAHLLLSGQEVVGAWLSVEDMAPGIFPLNVLPYQRN